MEISTPKKAVFILKSAPDFRFICLTELDEKLQDTSANVPSEQWRGDVNLIKPRRNTKLGSLFTPSVEWAVPSRPMCQHTGTTKADTGSHDTGGLQCVPLSDNDGQVLT